MQPDYDRLAADYVHNRKAHPDVLRAGPTPCVSCDMLLWAAEPA
jgi:hypothetical protein